MAARISLLRLLDANINRCREGLRVCEDVLRFCFNSGRNFRKIRLIRRSLDSAIKKVGIEPSELIQHRDVRKDSGRCVCGRSIDSLEQLLLMNLQRSKESLRVIEEVSRLAFPKMTSSFQRIRFELYDIEKAILIHVASIRNS